MFKEYTLKLKDKSVGKIVETENGLIYEVLEESLDDLGKRALPIGIFTREEVDSFTDFCVSKIYEGSRILRWLAERVFPKERHGATNFLISLELPSYDPWEIAKKTKAISFNDYYWIQIEDSDSFEKVHPRANEVDYDYDLVKVLLRQEDPKAAATEMTSFRHRLIDRLNRA